MSTDYTDTQLEMLTRRWHQDASPHLSLQLADVYRQRGQLEQALPILEQGLEAHPGHMSVQVALGRYRLEAGDPEGAAAVLRQVVDRDAGHLVANKLLVRAHLATGDRKSAGDRLELYALLNDNDPELETLRAMVKGAAPAARAAAPKPLPASFGRAVAAATGDLGRVAPPARRALSGGRGEPFAEVSAHPLAAGAGLDLFPALAGAPRSGAAEASPPVVDAIEPAVRGEPSEEDAGALGTSSVSEPAVAEAPRPVPERKDLAAGATSTLGALYLAQGHLDDARATFERVLERDPEDAEARAGLTELERRHAAGEEAVPATVGSAAEGGRAATIAHLQGYLSRIRKAADRLSA